MKNRLVQTLLTNLLIPILICFTCLVFAQTERKSPKKDKTGITQQNPKNSTKSKLSKEEKLALDGQKEAAKQLIKAKKNTTTTSSSTSQNANASNAKKAVRCFTDEGHQQRLQDPRYVDHLKFIQDKVQENLNRGYIPCDANNTVVIPVAVHFDAAYNCSNLPCIVEATEAQINSLNDDFAAANADLQLYNDIIANCGGTNVVSDGVCVSFCLANQNHPAGSGLVDGQPAITIGQYNGGGINAGGIGAPEWQGYLNMFVIDNYGGGVADGIGGMLNGDGVTEGGQYWGGPGFAPCSSGGSLNDDAAWFLGRTLTHEVGHYLGLYHTFQGGCGDEPNAPYDVNDTPAQVNPSFGVLAANNCAAIATGCVAGETVQFNFMDYFDDPSLVMFSNEQAIAMNTFSNVMTWANDVIDTGCSDFTETSILACVISAGFSPPDGFNLILCSDDGSPIFITDASSLAVSWNWTFTVTSGDLVLNTTSSTMQNPSPMVTAGTSGTVEVTQQACDNDGLCDTATNTYTITIASGDACPNECDYTLELTDTFGDGWNGALIDVQGNGVSLLGSPFGATFTTGGSEIITLTLTDTEIITFNQTNGGFPNEEGFILTDPFGNVIFDASAGNVGTGEVFSFTAYCDPPVCDDGAQNGSEGGVDCGGVSNCPDCCGNGVQDDLEGGLDCGGGSPCADCCSNGVQDDDETGVDCGGVNCVPCPSCADDSDEIINESFDSCMMPAGWSVTSTDGATVGDGFFFDAAPGDVPGGGVGPSADFAGCIALIDDDANDNIGIGCILTPIFDLTLFINTTLVFDWQHEAVGGGGELIVQVWDGTMWVTVFSADDDSNGINETVALDIYANANFQIQFCYDDEGGFQWGAGFDNIAVCGVPNEDCPTTINATDVSGDYCNGSTINLAITNNPNVNYAWSSSSASVVIADPTVAVTTASVANPQMCLAEAITISAVLTCAIDGTELFNGVVSTINAYPNPPATADDLSNYVDCTFATPIAGCENAITITPEADGITYTVTFAHAGGPNCCPDVTGSTTDIVTDGSFEAGPGGGAWLESSTNFGSPICDIVNCGTGTGTGPSDGDFWTWFGGIGASELGSVCQTISVPADIVSLTLLFDLEAIICDSPMDFMEATINGNQVFFVDGSNPLCGVLGYSSQAIELLATGVAPGTTIDLCFNSEIFGTNGEGSNFFVDNVQMLAEQPPGVDPCSTTIICNQGVPTLSQWGLIVLALLLMVFGSITLGFRTLKYQYKK